MKANVSSYIAAGNIAANQTSNIQAAAIRSGADFSKVTKEAQNQLVQSEIAGRRAAAGVVQAGMQGESLLKQAKAVTKPDKKGRMAGAVAAAGVLGAGAIFMARNNKNDADETAQRKSGTLLPAETDQSNTNPYSDPKAVAAEISKLESELQQIESKLLNPKELKTTSVSAKRSSIPLNLNSPEIQADLDTISFAEGTWNPNTQQRQYNIRFGGGSFDNSQPHPGTIIDGQTVSSSAHGAYQFMPDTWKGANDGANPVMSPILQDQAAVKLMNMRGYNPFGDFATESVKLAPEWASYPTEAGTSNYKLRDGSPQPSKSLDELTRFRNGRIDYYLRTLQQ